MQIAILSDIHGNLPALKTTLELCKTQYHVTKYLFLGDLIGYYPNPVECIDLISSLTSKETAIAGNHDTICLSDSFDMELTYFNEIAQQALVWTRETLIHNNHHKQWNWLKQLPDSFACEIEGIRIAGFHGSPDERWEYIFYRANDTYIHSRFDRWLAERSADIIFIGHTHRPFVYSGEKGLIINPGSVGQPRDGNSKLSFAILDTESLKVEIKRHEYPIEEEVMLVENASLPKILAERLSMGI